MQKKKLGDKSLLYPMPVTLVGADVAGKPNFMTIAFIGIVNANPGMVAFGANRSHLTNRGILANRTFSVNLPGRDLLEVTDYVGIHSGNKTDKSELFEVFRGELGTAPMIAACPLNLECRVLDVLEHGGLDQIIIGEIAQSYCGEEFLSNGLPDMEKIKPALFSMYDNRYFACGEVIGKAWHMGRDFKPGGRM